MTDMKKELASQYFDMSIEQRDQKLAVAGEALKLAAQLNNPRSFHPTVAWVMTNLLLEQTTNILLSMHFDHAVRAEMLKREIDKEYKA